MAKSISNADDTIDSRDVIARIEELESQREAYGQEAYDVNLDKESDDNTDDVETIAEKARTTAEEEWDQLSEGAELAALKALAEEAEGYAPDWRHGETLIRDSYFETFAQEFADDVGLIDRNAKWPLRCIDWEEAASELQQDYTAVDFDGVTYWIR